MDTPQIDDAILIAGQISAAIIAIGGAIAIIYRLFFKRICDQLDSIKQELKPNGGSSLRDAVNRIEETQSEMKIDIKDVREKIDNHIEWHLDH